jgi:uncharacterized membrane protein
MTSTREARVSSDRLVTFVDAIVAIAITLLVITLVEPVADAAREGLAPAQFLADNVDGLLAAAISFAVIARLWKAHHGSFQHVERYTSRLATITILWAGTIAFLPLPTAMAAEFRPDRLVLALYIGTMTVSSALLSATDWYVRRHPEIQPEDDPLTDAEIRGGQATTLLFVVALAGAMLVPAWSYWWLFALALTGPVVRILERGRGRPVDA